MTKYAAFTVPLTVAALALTGSAAATAAPAGGDAGIVRSLPASSGGGWSYDAAGGPAHWGEIAPTCAGSATGRQSPVDIPSDDLTTSRTVEAPALDYERTSFTVVDNGHTIEGVPTEVGTNAIMLDGTRYVLQQFHLHAPSEHTIDGRPAAMELHLVHRSDDGTLAVLGVLLKVGREHGALADFFDAIPAAAAATASAAPSPVLIDPTHLVPAWSDLVRYDGSLTTPPCSEGVLWNVYERPRMISKAQLAAFTAVHPQNSRPVQAINDRSLFEVDSH